MFERKTASFLNGVGTTIKKSYFCFGLCGEVDGGSDGDKGDAAEGGGGEQISECRVSRVSSEPVAATGLLMMAGQLEGARCVSERKGAR